jgi:hypothetical protein
MNILLVNGSPRPSGSASGSILETIRGKLGPEHRYTEVNARKSPGAAAACLDQDAIVIAFPLYVDSLPSRLLEWLLSFEALAAAPDAARSRRETAVFAICNCGFHEGAQTRTALRIVRNFALKSGFSWGGGLGIGTGGMINGMAKVPEEAWIKREVSRGIAWIAGNVADWGASPGQARLAPTRDFDGSVRFVSHAFPRFAYIMVANSGWRQEARANGLRVRELKARPIAR